MPFPRLTWAGLLIATLGWGFLLSYPLIAPHGTGPEAQDPARFVLIFGEKAITTGFALAILGALEKVLMLLSRHSNSPNATSRTAPRTGAAGNPLAHAAQAHTAQAQAQPHLTLQRSPNEVITRGALNGRDYVLFRDGSVLVETLLGPRRFPSITEAHEFIGSN